MKLTHHDLSIDLEDEWWVEAEMAGFIPASNCYRTDRSFSRNGGPILEVRIADVSPVGSERRAIGVFRDSLDNGTTARERVLKILRGFRLGDAIPPVEVVECEPGSPHRYTLKHGTHRMYCSQAAGFTHIPAVRAFEYDA
jgi:hypothetical protein